MAYLSADLLHDSVGAEGGTEVIRAGLHSLGGHNHQGPAHSALQADECLLWREGLGAFWELRSESHLTQDIPPTHTHVRPTSACLSAMVALKRRPVQNMKNMETFTP